MKMLIALTCMFLYCRRRGYSELAERDRRDRVRVLARSPDLAALPDRHGRLLPPRGFCQIDLLVERHLTALRRRDVIWTAMLFGGHPETVSHRVFFAGLFVALDRARWSARRRPDAPILHALFGLLAVAGLLSLPFIAPFVETVKKSKRFQELQVHRDSAEPPFSDLASASGSFQPHFYGELPREKPWGPATAESITGFAGILGIAAWFACSCTCAAPSLRSREDSSSWPRPSSSASSWLAGHPRALPLRLPARRERSAAAVTLSPARRGDRGRHR